MPEPRFFSDPRDSLSSSIKRVSSLTVAARNAAVVCVEACGRVDGCETSWEDSGTAEADGGTCKSCIRWSP